MDIHETGIEGRTFIFIQNFLKLRSFKVKVNEILSDTKVQTWGISQGSIVSPLFFMLEINKFVAELPIYIRFQIPLYMDDLQISYRHPNWKVVERKLQSSINVVEKFAWKNCFKFSVSKTSKLHFTELPLPPPIELRLGNVRVHKSETLKYLGFVFDSKLDWKARIQQLK